MRFCEFAHTPTIKPIKPMNPKQCPLYNLKGNKGNAKQAYKAEKDRQTVVKARQQIKCYLGLTLDSHPIPFIAVRSDINRLIFFTFFLH